MSTKFCTEPLEADDVKSNFICGQKDLDRYFARHALNNDQLGIGKTFVVRGKEDKELTILGFYVLSMASVQSSQISEVMQKKLPRYPMPVVLLGRLAVHQEAQGKGLGEFLLIDALRKSAVSAQSIGAIGVITDAKDEKAQSFYEKYGFVQLSAQWPKRMFLSFQTLADSEES